MSVITAEQQGLLSLQSLSKDARRTQVFKKITNASLISIGQLCDNDCEAKFTKKEMQVVSKNGTKVLQGTRNLTDGLWDVTIPAPTLPHPSVNAIIRKDKSKSELASYLHACAGSPPIDSFIRAKNNGNYVTWSGIDAINFKKHLDPTVETAKGHLSQERKNLQSTQHPVPIKQEHPAYVQDPTEFTPPPDSPNVKSYECFATIVNRNSKSGKAFHDLTGQFPHSSSR